MKKRMAKGERNEKTGSMFIFALFMILGGCGNKKNVSVEKNEIDQGNLTEKEKGQEQITFSTKAIDISKEVKVLEEE